MRVMDLIKRLESLPANTLVQIGVKAENDDVNYYPVKMQQFDENDEGVFLFPSNDQFNDWVWYLVD